MKYRLLRDGNSDLARWNLAATKRVETPALPPAFKAAVGAGIKLIARDAWGGRRVGPWALPSFLAVSSAVLRLAFALRRVPQLWAGFLIIAEGLVAAWSAICILIDVSFLHLVGNN